MSYKHQRKHSGFPDMTWLFGKNYKAIKNRKSAGRRKVKGGGNSQV